MKKIILLFIIVFVTVPTFAQDSDDEEEKEFTAAFSSTEISYNPLHSYTATEAQIYTALYEGLVTYHPFSLNPVPASAKRWEISADKKTYRFYIRENARYWNGDHVKAAHFKEAWMKLLDPDEKAEYSFLLDVIKGAEDFRRGVTDDPSTVGLRVPSERVLEVELEHPAGHFIKILCHHSFSPIHPQLVSEQDWTKYSSIVGNGPYYIIEKKESELVLRKNELYWDAAKVEIPVLRIVFNDDAREVTSLFNNGTIQWAADGMILDQVNDKETIVPNPMFSTSYFHFFCGKEPFDNPDVRRGLALLLDWEKIRSERFMFIPATALVPPIPRYPEMEGIQEENREEGFSLLEQAGFEKGAGLPEIVIKIPGGGESERVAEIMKTSWTEYLDVSVTVTTYQYPDYYEQLKQPDYTLGTITWIGDFADPLTFLQMWTSGSNLNDAQFSNDEFDTIIKDSMAQSGEKRYETLSTAEGIILDTAVVLPINHTPAFNLIDLQTIKGWYPNPLDIHPFKYFKFGIPKISPNIVMK